MKTVSIQIIIAPLFLAIYCFLYLFSRKNFSYLTFFFESLILFVFFFFIGNSYFYYFFAFLFNVGFIYYIYLFWSRY